MRRVFIPQQLQSLPSQLPVGGQHVLTGQSMGTTWTVRYIQTNSLSKDHVNQLIQRELELVVAQMSTWLPDANISLFNRADANTWHALPAPFFKVLDCALRIAEQTNGAFDPTVGPLVNRWGFGPQGRQAELPTDVEVNTMQASGGWQKLKLNKANCLALQPGGIRIDFSGIAKGYSVDRIAQALQHAGLEHYLIEVGGELYGAGIKPDGQPWWVALETPPDALSINESVLALHGLAVATSGDYRRYFEHKGQRYAHTIDPRTGFPVNRASNGLVSVTVLHAECMVADALATAFTVMGVKTALDYANQNHIAVFLIEQLVVEQKLIEQAVTEQKATQFKTHLSAELAAMLA